jgi:hypothetical protein
MIINRFIIPVFLSLKSQQYSDILTFFCRRRIRILILKNRRLSAKELKRNGKEPNNLNRKNARKILLKDMTSKGWNRTGHCSKALNRSWNYRYCLKVVNFYGHSY